jgi:hypothetical protein
MSSTHLAFFAHVRKTVIGRTALRALSRLDQWSNLHARRIKCQAEAEKLKYNLLNSMVSLFINFILKK